jgi:hypothetical protein
VSIERIPQGWKLPGSRQVKTGGEGDFPKFGTFELCVCTVVSNAARVVKQAVVC